MEKNMGVAVCSGIYNNGLYFNAACWVLSVAWKLFVTLKHRMRCLFFNPERVEGLGVHGVDGAYEWVNRSWRLHAGCEKVKGSCKGYSSELITRKCSWAGTKKKPTYQPSKINPVTPRRVYKKLKYIRILRLFFWSEFPNSLLDLS